MSQAVKSSFRLTFFLLALITITFLAGCSPTRQLSRSARETVLNDDALRTAHVGISIYEPATGKWWYNYQGDKYFVPASNTKIPTCYAAMKYLGDSLIGLKYDRNANGKVGAVQATGDPTLLHPDFRSHPVLEFLRQQDDVLIDNSNWQDEHWGSGWSWNDYDASYMAERSPMPVYGNVVRFVKGGNIPRRVRDSLVSIQMKNVLSYPTLFQDSTYDYLDYVTNIDSFSLDRDFVRNRFLMKPSGSKFISAEMPFVTYAYTTTRNLLADSLKKPVTVMSFRLRNKNIVYSQPTDSMLRPMMHRSDNFYAEQSLLMVSNEVLGVMNDSRIIDTLLKTDFKDLPHRPRWVDGSGLSRYNLFTPQDMVVILDKMQREFGMERIKAVFPTGGTGTLGSYYSELAGQIYAKTGTLSGVVALSGYLYTRQNRLLVYSVLVNNHQASATAVRRAVEKFLTSVRNSH